MRHRRAVGLHQQIVDKVDAEVHVLQPCELVGPFGLAVPVTKDVDGIERRAAAGELRAKVGREDLLPTVVAFEWRQVCRAHEALRLVVEARSRRRRRQPLNERACQSRQSTDTRREQVGRIRVIAPEELVAPFARQRDLDVARGELRHEIGRQRG